MTPANQQVTFLTTIRSGRAVGWLESDVDAWIVGRSAGVQEVAQ
jgi:predicted DNA-binding transcriptional regulator AlpA